MKTNWVVGQAVPEAVYWDVYDTVNQAVYWAVARDVDDAVDPDEAVGEAVDDAVDRTVRSDPPHHSICDFLAEAEQGAP